MAQSCCCSFLRSNGRRLLPVYGKYDLSSWRLNSAGYEEPNIIELRAALGRQIISELPAKFRSENKGRFVAITFTRKVLAICETLEDLNKEIAKKKLRENYYIERIGYTSITQI
jgi:hypothetical protein